MFKFFRKRLLLALILLAISFTIGTLGFMAIEGYSFNEALYMAVITLSTVGFQEVRPLSPEGRVFAIIFILSNLGVFTYTISTLSQLLLDGELKKAYAQYLLNKKLRKLENHSIVIGLGRNGMQSCQELHREGVPFVAIDQKEVNMDHLGFPMKFIQGDARQDHILEQACIEKARSLITALPDDADNVFVVITARHIAPHLHIISRASSDSSEEKLRRAGANNVIMPDKLGGAHMAQLVTKPDVMEFMDMISGQRDTEFCMAELSMGELQGPFLHTTISDLDIRGKTGANIIGFKTEDGHYVINPQANEKMTPHSKLIVLGTQDQIAKLESYYRKN